MLLDSGSIRRAKSVLDKVLQRIYDVVLESIELLPELQFLSNEGVAGVLRREELPLLPKKVYLCLLYTSDAADE